MKSPRDQRPGFGQLARVAPSAIRLVIAAANARFSGPRSDWARRTPPINGECDAPPRSNSGRK